MHSVSKRVRLSVLTVKIRIKIDLYCQRRSQLTVGLCRYSTGFPGKAASNNSGVFISVFGDIGP